MEVPKEVLSSLATSLGVLVETGQVQTFDSRCATIKAMVMALAPSHSAFQKISVQLLSLEKISHQEYVCIMANIPRCQQQSVWTPSNIQYVYVPAFAGRGFPPSNMQSAPAFTRPPCWPPSQAAIQAVPAFAAGQSQQPVSSQPPLRSSSSISLWIADAERNMRKYRIRHDCKYWNSAKLAMESAHSLLGILDAAGSLHTSGGSKWLHNYKCRGKECGLFFRITQCAPEGVKKQVWVISQRTDGSGDYHSAHCSLGPKAQGTAAAS